MIEVPENSSLNTNLSSTSVTLQNLIPGNYYTFLVSALTGGNTVKGDSNSRTTYTRPDIVKALTIVNVTTTSVSLSWLPPEGNTSSYMIEVPENSTLNTNLSSTSVTIGNLIPGNFYTFLVSALTGENTVKGDSNSRSTYTRPEIVKALTIVNVTTTSVSLSWLPPEGNTSSYMIEVPENSSQNTNLSSTSVTLQNLIPGNYYTFLVSALTGGNTVKGDSNSRTTYTKNSELNTNLSSTSVTIGNLIPGNYYTFLVSALTGENTVKGDSNSRTTYTTPGKVPIWNIEAITTTSISLTWQKPQGNVSLYRIQTLGDKSSITFVPTTTYTSEGLTPGNSYTFVVFALVGEGNLQGESNNITTYTRPSTVTELTAAKLNSSSMYVTWRLPEGNRSSYLVEVIGNPPQSFTVYSESATITNLTSGIQYTVRISAVAGNGLQGERKWIFVLVAENITATLITKTSLWLSWDPYGGQNTTYSISVYGEPPSNRTVNTTAVQITNLTSGNLYKLQVSAYESNDLLYGYGGEISFYTLPDVVINIQIANVSTNSIYLSWSPPKSNYSYYLIEVIGDVTQTMTKTSQSVAIQNLTPGNQYTVKIRAVTGVNIQGDAKEITVTTRPEVVKNLTMFSISDTSVSLRWLPPEGKIRFYVIRIQENDAYNTTTEQNSVTIQDLRPGTKYTVLVSAAVTGASNLIEGNNVPITVITELGVVSNLIINSINTTYVTLSWQPPNRYTSSYLLRIQGDSTFYRNITTTSYTIENLIPGNYYTFLVSVFDAEHNVEGNSSAISAYTIPEKVRSFFIKTINTSSVFLGWDKPEGYADSYLLQIFGDVPLITNINTTFYTAGGLTPGNNYIFQVSAVVGGNVTGDYSLVSGYTQPDIVRNLKTGDITTNSISVNWEKPNGNADSYLIQILGNSTIILVDTTSYTVRDLIPGNDYTFLVTAIVGGNINGETSPITMFTRPDVVRNLNTVNVTTNSISLTWELPAGKTDYYLIQMVGNSTFNRTVTTTSATIRDLIAGNYYTFSVSAVVGGNVIGLSSQAASYTKPTKVKNLLAETINTTSLYLSWDKPEGSADSYQIQILGDITLTTSVTTTSYTVGGLTPGNYYSILVSAVVGGNVIGDNSQTYKYTRPDVVRNLNIVNVTTSSISLTWELPAGKADSYLIQMVGNSTFNRTVTTTSATIGELIAGNYYTFSVSAVVGGNVIGLSSQAASYTIPTKVKNLLAETINTTSLYLSWDKPDGSADSYQIQISGDITLTTSVTTTSYTVGGLTPGNYYSILVSAVVGGNVIGDNSQTYKYTQPGAVKNLAAGSITTISFSLSWSPPDGGVSAYQIQFNGTSDSTLNTKYTIEGLSPGNVYTVVVSALVGESKIQGEGSSVAVQTRPDVVRNLNTVNVTTSSISLTWELPAGITGSYLIQMVGNLTFNRTVTTTSATIGELIAGNYYTFSVSAVVGGNVIGLSSQAASYTKPGAVKNLAAGSITTTSFSLSWSPPDGGVSAYQIQFNGTSDSTLNTKYTIEGLSPGNVYTVVVSALVGESKIQGEGSSVAVQTNAHSLFISLTFSSTAANNQILIINEINRILQDQYRNKNVTAVWKQNKIAT
ncbi:receptor-type tyrosine-protein phosphatase beta-like [Dendropsophus ebraccatus]|uniref:receptor-type tyrosine-protein phosphatase beta-like n=1 Tax=Dendropsophus ebraccatus TaxID=150705 RepID=UPI0038320DE2